MFIQDLDEAKLEELVLGRRIVSATDNSFTLDNGVKIRVATKDFCCGWFRATTELIDFSDNAITAVTRKNTTKIKAKDRRKGAFHGAGEEGDKFTWSLNLYSANVLVARANIDAKIGNGYYGTSIDIEVEGLESADV